MKTIAISVFGNRISSRLDVSEKFMLIKIENHKVKNKETFLLEGNNTSKRLDTLLQLRPDVLICGGLTEFCKKRLSNNKIKVIPWVQGETDQILDLYLKGSLNVKNNFNN